MGRVAADILQHPALRVPCCPHLSPIGLQQAQALLRCRQLLRHGGIERSDITGALRLRERVLTPAALPVEKEELKLGTLSHEDMLGVQVAMNNSAIVKPGQGLTERHDQHTPP